MAGEPLSSLELMFHFRKALPSDTQRPVEADNQRGKRQLTGERIEPRTKRFHMDDQLDVAWATGLIEGEGSIIFRKRKRNGGRSYDWTHSVKVGMTDKDVLDRLPSILGGNVTGPYEQTHRKESGEKYKPFYVWQVSRRCEVLRVIALIRPLLGERRGAKADEVTEAINSLLYRKKQICLSSSGTLAPQPVSELTSQTLATKPDCS